MAPTRDAPRTRRILLDAAARAVLAHGATVSLEVVAREAGVSKGGLLHHFPSKDALFSGLVDDLMNQFDATVEAHLDPADDRPGRLTRAYVRAVFANLGHPNGADTLRHDATLMAALGHLPQVLARAQEDARHWKEAFARDGLHPQRSSLITRAADGTATASLFEGRLEPRELEETRELLLALTEETGPLLK